MPAAKTTAYGIPFETKRTPTKDEAARAMLAALKNARDVMGTGNPENMRWAWERAVAAIAQAEAAGIR
jgi:hypothetical protein